MTAIVRDDAWLLTKACKDCGVGLLPPVTSYHRKSMYRCVACHLAKTNAWKKANPARVRATHRASNIRTRNDPAKLAKIRVRRKLHYAIECGRLKRRPCERCGKSVAQAHHSDYGKPYDVTWLCSVCHTTEHRARSAPMERTE